jgi:sensor c-di-GMP phosphodiesterase-like protein
MRRQASYKVIIDIDGYTYSQRLTQLMKMGVAILKIKVFEDIGSILPQPW